MNIDQSLMNMTKMYLIQLNIPFDSKKANDYFVSTYPKRFEEIISEVKKDANAGDIFGSLSYGKIDPLTRAAAEISLKHGCLQYAKEILEHSKN